jgi:hypothetical protein
MPPLDGYEQNSLKAKCRLSNIDRFWDLVQTATFAIDTFCRSKLSDCESPKYPYSLFTGLAAARTLFAGFLKPYLLQSRSTVIIPLHKASSSCVC